MKDKEYENKRHNLVLERISIAKNIKELPNVTLSSLAKFLADNVYYDKKHLSTKEFKPFIMLMIDNGMVLNNDIKNCFINILKTNYPNHTSKEFEDIYKKIIGTGRINNMFIEMSIRAQKIKDIQDDLDLEKHKQIMDDIKHATSIKDIDNIFIPDLDELVKKDTLNEIITNIPKKKLSNLIYLIYNKKSYQEIDLEIENICRSFNLKEEDHYIMYNQILAGITVDKKINYVVDELRLKEKQVKGIYKNEHLHVLEKISEALDISQLPKGLNATMLCHYLEANSKINISNKTIKASDFNNYVEIILNGKSINSKIAKNELKNIVAKQNYGDLKKAFELLLYKFNSLYRIDYYVEEINLARKREKEFTGNQFIDVELFIIPTPNTPENGGIHYTLFKNEVSNLDLDELKLNYHNLDELVEQVQQISPSFKPVGGIILSPKEKITIKNGSNIKLYHKAIGEQTIENSRLAKIEELTMKQNKLLELQAEEKAIFDEKQKITTSKLKEIQKELLDLTNTLDDDIVNSKKKEL